MIPILYLIACFCSTVSYDLARSLTTFKSSINFFNNSQLPIKVMQMFWYCDIIILIIAIISAPFLKKKYDIAIFSPKVYLKNKKIIFLFLIVILSSNLKSFISSSISGDVIITYSLLTPFVALILNSLILKEKFNTRYAKALFVAFTGFAVTKINKLTVDFHLILLIYVFINAGSVIAIRYISVKRKNIEGIIFENMIYAFQGVVLFLIFGGFSFKMLISWQVLIVAIPSIIHHVYIVIGNQKAKHTSLIILTDFLKTVITFGSCFFFFRKTPTIHEFIGISIILTSLFFLRKNKINS